MQTFGIIGVKIERCGQFFPFFFIEHDNRRDKRTVFPNDVGLLKKRINFNGLLQVSRRYLFSGTGHNDFFNAANDTQITFVIELAHITSLKPTVFSKGVFGVLGTIPIAFHDRVRLHLNFVIRAQTYLRAGQRLADSVGMVVGSGVSGNDRARFRHPITLRDHKTKAAENFSNFAT